jgi:hypothetical protein
LRQCKEEEEAAGQDVVSLLNDEPFALWCEDRNRDRKLRRLIFSSSDRTLKSRFFRFTRKLGMPVFEAALRAFQMRDEDRQAAALGGPLRVIEDKVYYFPGPGEKFMPWDLPEQDD